MSAGVRGLVTGSGTQVHPSNSEGPVMVAGSFTADIVDLLGA